MPAQHGDLFVTGDDGDGSVDLRGLHDVHLVR
jgi:hypothetical protein